MGLQVSTDPTSVAAVMGLEKPGPGPFRKDSDGIAVEMLTSGTTGPPKRIPLKYKAFEHTVDGFDHSFEQAFDGVLDLEFDVQPPPLPSPPDEPCAAAADWPFAFATDCACSGVSPEIASVEMRALITSAYF